MTAFLRGSLAAVMLLTRVPITMRLKHSDWTWATAWFPIVGAAIGGFAAIVWWLAQPLGAWPAAIMALGATTFVTGALHEDGLADTADALGGSHDRDKVFAILKDSRIGTYGAAALVLVLMLRVSLLAGIGVAAPAALVLSHAIARLCPAVMMSFVPYVTPPDAAKSSAVSRPHPASPFLAAAGAFVIVAGLRVGGWMVLGTAVSAAAVAAALTLLLARYFVRRVGGVTGDFLGATEQVVESGVLVAVAATCC